MILMQQPLQTSCLLSARAFTHSYYQTVMVLLFFVKSCMSVLHWQMLELFGKMGSGKCSSKLLPCDAGKIIESGIGDADFLIDKTSIYRCVLISLPLLIHRIAYLIVLYFSIDIFWRSFSVGYTSVILLAVVSCPLQRLYQLMFLRVVCHFLLFCILSSLLQKLFYLFWPTPCLKTIILADVIPDSMCTHMHAHVHSVHTPPLN